MSCSPLREKRAFSIDGRTITAHVRRAKKEWSLTDSLNIRSTRASAATLIRKLIQVPAQRPSFRKKRTDGARAGHLTSTSPGSYLATKPLEEDRAEVVSDKGAREPSGEIVKPWIFPVPGVST